LAKTLAEIAIDAGLVTKADAARAGRLAETKKHPLIVVLVRDLRVDEIALVAAMRRQMGVQLIDPANLHVDTDALRTLAKDACVRLHVLPLTIGTDAAGARVMKVAMADPTDSSAIAELEELTSCEIEVTALPLSAVEEWIAKAYKGLHTAVVKAKPRSGEPLFVTTKLTTAKVQRVTERELPSFLTNEGEISETAQIAIRGSPPPDPSDLEVRVAALVRLLIAKNVITEAELEAQVQELLSQPRNGTRTT
jgi:hypothetical protein